MPRPHKLKVKTTTLNIILPISVKEQISKEAHLKSKQLGKIVSMAEIIRERIKKGGSENPP